jgi:hypothetical protein
MRHYVAVRPVGFARVAAYVKPHADPVPRPVRRGGLTEELPDFRLELTSAAIHHVHVPAAALEDV